MTITGSVLLLFGIGLALTGAWCLAGAIDSIWNAWSIRQRAKHCGRFGCAK